MSFVDTRTNPTLFDPLPRRARTTGLLLQVPVVQETGSSEWEFMGTQFLPLQCESDPHIAAPSCAWPSPDAKTPDEYAEPVITHPFYLWRAATCDANTILDLEGRARDTLDAFRGQDIEHGLWSGVVDPDAEDEGDLFPGSFQGGTIIGPLDEDDAPTGCVPTGAMALMMQALAGCGGQVIHVPVAALPFLVATNQLVRNGNHITTFDGGFEVIVGYGYPGTGPDNEDPPDGKTWIVGTGAIRVRLSEVRVLGAGADGVDRTRNSRTVIAEQSALVEVDTCCLFWTLMDLTNA